MGKGKSALPNLRRIFHEVLVINCGSSSLKYQLIDMEGEKVLCKGLCERIGMESSMITHEANGHKATTPAIFPTHTEAFTEVVKKMTTGGGKVIESVSEIDAIGTAWSMAARSSRRAASSPPRSSRRSMT